jgi:DNA helicase II / ATP-dependent DNA helicase PcrA
VNILLELNSKQLDAVTHSDGSMLVLAGAGSGKTRVLTTRIAWLVSNNYASPSEILAVTFTNKAAREMMSRASNLLKIDPKSLWIGTFHSIALKILTRHHVDAGLPSYFHILDTGDQLSLIKRLVKAANLSEEKYNSRDLQKFINYQKENGKRAKDMDAPGLRQKICWELYAEYENVCNRDGLVDFTELLLRSYELLSTHERVLTIYREQFKHILVDEFQDTNYLQYRWLRMLAGDSSKIFAVGDDDQSIYSFRGADVGNMSTFLRDFNINNPIRLEQNYRSTPNILAAANAIIGNNNDRIGKNLWTDNNHGEKIRWYEGYTEEDEAYFVVDEIETLISGGVKLSEIVILYRSNAQSRVFEHMLYTKAIPYRVYGGLRFFDRQEVKHVLAYARLLLNPHDNEAFLRVVNVPPRGIGTKTIENLQISAKENEISLYDACSLNNAKPQLNLLKFVQLIRLMTEETQALDLPEIINYIVASSSLGEHYRNDKKGGLERLENLSELVNSVSAMDVANDIISLSDFLAHAVLESGDGQSARYENAVQLMTVHAAKGLEFKVVFVVGCEDGLFPHENCLRTDEDAEEERRLMYVAVTRAKETLYLLRACSRMMWGKRLLAPVSRFIHEIPNDLISNISGLSKIGQSNLNEYGDYDEASNDCSEIANIECKTSRVDLTSQNMTLKIGDIIKHTRFGSGKITRLNVAGDKITAEIFFIGLGKKTLDLNIAKVEKI